MTNITMTTETPEVSNNMTMASKTTEVSDSITMASKTTEVSNDETMASKTTVKDSAGILTSIQLSNIYGRCRTGKFS